MNALVYVEPELSTRAFIREKMKNEKNCVGFRIPTIWQLLKRFSRARIKPLFLKSESVSKEFFLSKLYICTLLTYIIGVIWYTTVFICLQLEARRRLFANCLCLHSFCLHKSPKKNILVSFLQVSTTL